MTPLSAQDISSWKSHKGEVEITLKDNSRLYVVPQLTGKDRFEMPVEAINPIIRTLQLFPGSKLTHWQNFEEKEARFMGDQLSYSKISTFEQCPLKFRRRYIDKLKGPGASMDVGRLCHEVVGLTLQDFRDQERTEAVSESRVLAALANLWGDSNLVGQDSYTDVEGMLRRWSANMGHVDHNDILAVEKSFKQTFSGQLVAGVIDYVRQLNRDTIEVIDWKSNRRPFSKSELESSLQLSLYAIAAKRMWPWAKHVRLTYYLFRHGIWQTTERTHEQLVSAARYVGVVGEQIRGQRKWEPRINNFCAWCDYRQTCPAYRLVCGGAQHEVGESLAEKARALEATKKYEAILKRRRTELEDQLKAAVTEDGPQDLADDLPIYQFNKRRTLSYTPSRVVERVTDLIPALGQTLPDLRRQALDQVCKVDKAKLEKFVNGFSGLDKSQRRILQAELEAEADERFTSRFEAVKR